MHLSKLRASSLRGLPANWPEVKIGERGLVIYGPNGVGKSSIIDAIEFGLTNESTLYPERRMGVNWEAGSPHVLGGRPSVSVTVTLQGRDHVIEPGIAPPPAIADWCGKARRSKFVLRRHMLLRFINVEPRHRYAQLEPFLNLESFQKTEAALERLAGSAQLELGVAEVKHRTAEQTVRAIFGLIQFAPLSDAALLAILNGRLRDAGLEEIQRLDQLVEFKAVLANELGGNEKDQRLAKLHALKGQAQRLGVPGNYRPLMEQLTAAQTTLEAEIAGRTGEIITDLLVRARAIIQGRDASDCPVCEQPIERDVVLARLAERIAADERITAAKNAVRARAEAVRAPVQAHVAAMKSFLEDWPAAVRTPLPPAYNQTLSLLEEIVAALQFEISSQQGNDFAGRMAAALASHAPAIDAIDALIAAEGGGVRRQKLSDAMLMLEGLQTNWSTCGSLGNSVQAIRTKKLMLERLHGHAVEARKQTVQKLLDDVSGVANGLYEALHPGEELACSKLSVRPTEEGSVLLHTRFYGVEAPPALHYSESHLDTLGLCYFLALRRREADQQPDFKVLVLDDVVHSVDAEHRTRFVALLREKFGDHQIIISTHDSIFYGRLKQAFGRARHEYLALNGWRIDRGPLPGDPSTDLDRVLDEQRRLAMAPEELSAACGRFFEWLLRQLTERLEVAIPARFEKRHDIGSMWPPLAKKLKSQRHFAGANPTLVDDINANAWVRNEVGAHYNEPAAPVDPAEVRQFAQNLALLYSVTYCDACGTFIKKVEDKDWRCDCAAKGYNARDGAVQQPAE